MLALKQAAIEADPSDFWSMQNLALALEQLGKRAEALSTWDLLRRSSRDLDAPWVRTLSPSLLRRLAPTFIRAARGRANELHLMEQRCRAPHQRSPSILLSHYLSPASSCR